MDFFKHKAGMILLVVCLILIIAAIWYLMFGMAGGGEFEGGTLVERIGDIRMLVCL